MEYWSGAKKKTFLSIIGLPESFEWTGPTPVLPAYWHQSKKHRICAQYMPYFATHSEFRPTLHQSCTPSILCTVLSAEQSIVELAPMAEDPELE
jgi:hypothetical protein